MKTDINNWHWWFAWYPVVSIEYGLVWLRWLRRKKIPAGWERPKRDAPLTHRFFAWAPLRFSEWATGCWHRIPDDEY